MKKIEFPHPQLLLNTNYISIDNEVILIDSHSNTDISVYPIEPDFLALTICEQGGFEGSINLNYFKVKAPALTVALPSQKVNITKKEENIITKHLLISKNFMETLLPNIKERIPLLLSINNSPIIELTTSELETINGCFKILKFALNDKNNINRKEVAKHLLLAFYYGIGLHTNTQNSNQKSHYEQLTEKFLILVRKRFREQRSVEYYASELFVTPKHLSKVILEVSGISAKDWITKLVIIESKTLLKSSALTIQQISDELNFPSQSFFGKYFKRNCGISPKKFRES